MIHILLPPQKRWGGKLSLNPKGVQWLYSFLTREKKFQFPCVLSQNLEMSIMKIVPAAVSGSFPLSTVVR